VNPPYVLAGGNDRERREESERIALVERYHDPLTAAALAAVGVVPGWHVWEVGAGGGSVARRLSELVGPAGSVLATDLDPGPVAALGLPNVRALRHDLLADPPPADDLDLVHSRLVLLHLPRRREAVGRMAAALRPGGALVLGDVDFADHAPLAAPEPSWTRMWDGFREAATGAGWDLEIGRRLPEMLQEARLERVESLRMGGDVAGGSLRCRLQRATLERLRPAILATGRCDAADLDAAGAMLLDPARAFRSPEIWAAWGRRPPSAGAGPA
jgi:SAM-dependent methyltransferase